MAEWILMQVESVLLHPLSIMALCGAAIVFVSP